MVGVAGLVLAAGTYAMRGIGPLLPERFVDSPKMRRTVENIAILLLVGVMATSTVVSDSGFAGWARFAGVVVGGILAWFRAPLLVVIVAAASVTAILRGLLPVS
ncbi:AzlD domain-containing protein [Hoyosella rhizosphaerae]|nr:AzlD domain-containing protein [Hoyosella rhizosphaerae]